MIIQCACKPRLRAQRSAFSHGRGDHQQITLSHILLLLLLLAVKFLANINHNNFLLSIIYCFDFSEKILQAMFKDIPKKEIAATFASVGDVNRAAELLLLKKCKILISFCHSSGTYQIQGGRFLAVKGLASFLLFLYMTWYCFLSILTFKPIQWLLHSSTPTDI